MYFERIVVGKWSSGTLETPHNFHINLPIIHYMYTFTCILFHVATLATRQDQFAMIEDPTKQDFGLWLDRIRIQYSAMQRHWRKCPTN